MEEKEKAKKALAAVQRCGSCETCKNCIFETARINENFTAYAFKCGKAEKHGFIIYSNTRKDLKNKVIDALKFESE